MFQLLSSQIHKLIAYISLNTYYTKLNKAHRFYYNLTCLNTYADLCLCLSPLFFASIFLLCYSSLSLPCSSSFFSSLSSLSVPRSSSIFSSYLSLFLLLLVFLSLLSLSEEEHRKILRFSFKTWVWFFVNVGSCFFNWAICIS